MHPVREQRVDIAGRRHYFWNGDVECDDVQVHPFGLYMSRPVRLHPRMRAMQSLFLPGPGLIVSRFLDEEGQPIVRWFVDIAAVTAGPEVWEARDYYLDVVVHLDGRVEIEDTGEYLAAVAEGHLTAHEAAFALTTTHDLLNALQAHGGSLTRYLGALGVVFPGLPADSDSFLAKG